MNDEAIKSALATINLKVSLDKSANPPVVIDDREKEAKKGDKLMWTRMGAENFKFTDFQPRDPVFQNVNISDNKITCDFDGDDSGKKYPYTILVEDDCGDTYSSDEKADIQNPDEGRAVIRN